MQNIWAVGRNYSDHNNEMGYVPAPPSGDPVIFLKAGSCYAAEGEKIVLPGFSKEVHNEMEIAFRFGPHLEFDAYTVALDLTARDFQSKATASGTPWTISKSFRGACPMGPWQTFEPVMLEKGFEFRLLKNDEIIQKSSTLNMIYPVEFVRKYVLERFPVVPGDALLTGTPAGVGPIASGDVLVLEITNTAKPLKVMFTVA